MNKFLSKGFTLAEVLITLSILGVVVAIIIPNVIKNYQKQATVSRLKMAYSMLDRLTQQSYIENGYPTYTTDNFDKYFAPYLNIAKDCGRANNYDSATRNLTEEEKEAYRNPKEHLAGCFKVDDKGYDTYYALDGSNARDFCCGYSFGVYRKVLLKNGMSLAYAAIAPQINNGLFFVIDIDGPNKGDSKMGQDIFYFKYYSPTLNSNFKCQQTGIFPSSNFPASNSCQSSRPDSVQCCSENGSCNSLNKGTTCANLIIKDGWKISSDYPWAYAHKK